jgi:death on curing protein
MQYLTREQVLKLHRRMVDAYGGLDGLRDSGLLDSALNMPCAMFDGKLLHPDVPSACAAYLFHLCQNHPFADGNKRAAAVAAFVFASANGYALTLDEPAFQSLVMDVSAGNLNKTPLTAILRAVLERRGRG